MVTSAIASLVAVDAAVDGFSVPTFFGTDWQTVGGWSLFVGLCLAIVVGAAFEWWVPGRRHRRVEESAAKQAQLLAETVELLKDQTMANEITKDFFEKTVPKRGGPSE
jgi:hypothetical protein